MKFDEQNVGDLLETARSLFRENLYNRAEPLLMQLLQGFQQRESVSAHSYKLEQAEIWHMLAVIFYDRGKFSKAIKSFKKALEIDPTFTDASVGLSIILNDLGRYEEGRRVFLDAQAALKKKNFEEDVLLKESVAAKHWELGDLYASHKRWDDALDQYRHALQIVPKKIDIRLKVIDAYIGRGEPGTAFREIRQLVAERPNSSEARLKFGLMLFQAKRVADAIDQWETVLLRDPENPKAKEYLRRAREVDETIMEL